MKYKFKDGDCTVSISIEVPEFPGNTSPPIRGILEKSLDAWWDGFTDVMTYDHTSDDYDNPYMPYREHSSDLYKLDAQAAEREHSSYLRYKLGAQAAESLKAKRMPVA